MTGVDRPTSVVTGGAGFLGSNVCSRLVEEGHRVVCLDNLLTGSLDNVSHLTHDPSFEFVEHDVTEPVYIDNLLAGSGWDTTDFKIDYVLHLAGPASPRDYATHPIHTLKVGSLGTHNALGLARAHGATFLLASSSEVYGNPQINPQPETYNGNVNPVGPRSVYDEAKRFAEAMASAYFHTHGLDVRIARIFNCYGPNMRLDDGRSIPTFMSQALSGEPLTVYGDGLQTRSYCYVDDAVEALYRLLTYQRREGDELIMNIGNPEEISILELAQDVIDVTGSSSIIAFKALPEDDPRARRPDITRARDLLGWEPKVTRMDGLKRLLPYFKRERAAVPA